MNASGLDRAALLDRLGDVDQPSPDWHSWQSRASVAARLPDVLGLDQQGCYRLAVQVVRHLAQRRRTP